MIKEIKKPKCKFCENDGIIFADLDGCGKKAPVCWKCYSKEDEKRKKNLRQVMLKIETHS